MKAKTIDIKELEDVTNMSLRRWQRIISRLVQKHGPNALMSVDAGYNNVTFKLETSHDDEV